MAGKLEKLSIQPCKDPKCQQEIGQPFKVLINPEKYSRKFVIEYNDQQPMGSSGGAPAFSRILPETINLEFIFDGTGAIPSPAGGPTKTVSQWLSDFKTATFEYNGDIHSTNYLLINWGSLVFKCRLQQYSVDYTLFKEDGTPLRAKVSAEFKEFTDADTMSKEKQNQSPDLSHVHTFLAGDSLTQLCYKIYDDPLMYMEVARHNNLVNFRNIQPGTQIYFPPVKK